MNTIQLRMKALLDIAPSMVKTDDQTAVMKLNSGWDLKVTILEKSIIYEARSKGKSYNPKKDTGIPPEIVGVIETLEEKYTAALLALLDETADYSASEGKKEEPAEDPLDNLKAGGFKFDQEAETQDAPIVDSTPKETPLKDLEKRSQTARNQEEKKELWRAPPKQSSKKQEEKIIDANFEEVDPGVLPTLPAPVGIAGIVRPAVSAMEALAAWKEFQELKKYIIEPSDVQTITTWDKRTGKEKKSNFIKKSGWRKFATFYNLTDRIVEEKLEKSGTGFLWKIKVVCAAPNGRETEGVGMCASTERGFTHPDHDVYATAHTRAKNRAISDMIAAGEVSYEEVADGGMV